VYHESELERRCSTVIQVRKDVRELYSQYPVLHYPDVDGVFRKHICDFCVVFEDGYTVAVAVKNASKAAKLRPVLESIKSSGFLSKAKDGKLKTGAVDDIRLMTELDATYSAYENAQAILRSRRLRDEGEYLHVLSVVRSMPRVFRFGELLRGCQSRAARRAAVWLLIDDAVLVPENQGPVDDLTRLTVRR
jgi:predicted RNase H-like HicB family nuclease